MSSLQVVRLTLAALLAGAATAGADTLTRSVQDVTAISDGRGSGRVLFDASAIGDLGDVAISRATLTFSLSGEVSQGTTSLRLHPITAPWSPGTASWSSWSRPGGDFDEGVYTRTELDLGRSGTVSMDATLLIKMIEGGMTTYGFILTEDSGGGDGLASDVTSRLQNLGQATLEIRYRKTPPKPRGA